MKLQKISGVALVVVALMMAFYHLASTRYIIVDPILHKVLHVGFALVIILLGGVKASKGKMGWFPALLAFASIVVTVYLFIYYDAIKARLIAPPNPDIVIGLVIIVVMFITTTMAFGKTLPIVVLVLLAYTIFGQYLPEPFRSPELSLRDQLIPYLSTGLGTGWGIYGEVVAISANYIFLLVLFGSVLDAAGGTRFIMGIGNLAGAKLRSGPAAVAVVGSSLLGMVTGSTAANITITGSFTIPMMKKVGYKPEQAAAIELASSNGGQIMPPIMGAAAFVMAGFTGIPYVRIVIAAIIPAILYYVVVMMYAQFQAAKMHISQAQIKVDKRELLLDTPLFIVPFAVLTVLMLQGYSLMNLAFWATVSALVTGLIRKKTRPSLGTLIKGFTRGAKSGSEIAVSTALIGIIVTCFSVTGLGMKLPMLVETLSGGSLPIALGIIMVVTVILSSGVPTVVAYLMVAVIAVPVVIRMGVPLLEAHFFAMYYAAFAHLTPPVAIGAIVAAGLAGAKFWPTCWEGLKAAFTALIIPWLIVYAPVMVFKPRDLATGAVDMVGCILAPVALQIVLSNYLLIGLDLKERAGFALATIAFFTGVFTEQYIWLGVGAAITVLAVMSQWVRHKSASTLEQASQAPGQGS